MSNSCEIHMKRKGGAVFLCPKRCQKARSTVMNSNMRSACGNMAHNYYLYEENGMLQ